MVLIFDTYGKQISASRNLRGILERTRKLGASGMKIVVGVTVQDGGGCYVGFTWADESNALTFFASKSVATEWVNRRSMKDAHITVLKD